jgi:hypothetical protein
VKVDVLGWSGVLVPEVKVLGVRADLVVRIDHAAHVARRASGHGPVLDRDVLATWEWPESSFRAPEVVSLVGAVGVGTTWRRALAAAVRLHGFCSTAVVVEEDDEECRLECAYLGVGLVAAGRLVDSGHTGRSPRAHRRTLDRWLEELVYERLIDDGVLA